jgi:hypothetical protein
MANSKEGRAAYRAAMIPEGAVRDPRSSEAGEAYTYVSRKGKPGVITFWGSAGKPNMFYTYPTEELRATAINDFFKSLGAHTAYRTERKEKAKAFTHTLKLGDVLHTSWGYDQTNVGFFEVTKIVSEKSVGIRRIESRQVSATGPMSSTVEAVPGKYCGEEKVRRVREGNIVVNAEYTYSAYLGGGPTYSSWGH